MRDRTAVRQTGQALIPAKQSQAGNGFGLGLLMPSWYALIKPTPRVVCPWHLEDYRRWVASPPSDDAISSDRSSKMCLRTCVAVDMNEPLRALLRQQRRTSDICSGEETSIS